MTVTLSDGNLESVYSFTITVSLLQSLAPSPLPPQYIVSSPPYFVNFNSFNSYIVKINTQTIVSLPQMASNNDSVTLYIDNLATTYLY